MTTYAIGDIHGCRRPLDRLLDTIEFHPDRDRVWLVGDLVNGGPDSLSVLRWARDLGDRATVVLGNHDLHMLAVASGAQSMRPEDNFEDVLEAPDGDDLLDWLRHRPLVHRRDDFLMVHAGLHPSWTARQAERLAGEVESTLRGPAYADFFDDMYGNRPRQWDASLSGADRLRLIVNATTRMRTVTQSGAIDLSFKRTLDAMPGDLLPWYEHPERASEEATVLFGHWSALGYHHSDRVYCLDSAARWGGKLTALRLEDQTIFQVESDRPSVFD